MTVFNPQRLDVARKRRGFSKAALSETANVSPRMLTAVLSGERQPSDDVLSRLAEALRFTPPFFFGDDLPEPPVDGTSFRALSTMSAKKRDEAFGAAAIGITLSDWLDDRFELPKPTLPRYDTLDPETAAASVRSEWGLGERPIRNVVQLIESRGVRVFSLPEECTDIDAFSFHRDGVPYVFLNTRKSAEHSRMDAAHELGHLVLHWRGGARGRDAEFEAARFGSAFLMPEGSVKGKAPIAATLPQIVRLKRQWGVSVAALTYRLHVLGMLTDWQYRTLFMQLSRSGYRTKEPIPMRPETSQLLAKAFGVLREEGMTKADVAGAMNISERDLNEVIFGLVITSVEPAPTPEERPLPTPPRGRLRLIKPDNLD